MNLGRRPVSIVVAVLAAVAVYLAGTTAGVDLVVPRTLGDLDTTQTMPFGVVVAVATLAGLAGWGVAFLLERYTRMARDLWLFSSFLVFLASIVPVFMLGQVGADFFWQISLHLVFAAALVAGFWPTFDDRVIRSLPAPSPDSDEDSEGKAGEDDSEE